jgi:CrcB protein
MIYNILLVGIGGGIGAILRFVLGVNFTKLISGSPVILSIFNATTLVNIIGSFFIGLVYSMLIKFVPDEHQNYCKLFLMIGVLGGFTTFSSFSLDVFTLLESGKIFYALLYIVTSVTLCVLATFAGVNLVRIIH